MERCCDLAKKSVSHLKQVGTPCVYDHQLKHDDFEVVGEMALLYGQIWMTGIYLARIGRPDILWTADTHATAVAKIEQQSLQHCSKALSGHHSSVVPMYTIRTIQDSKPKFLRMRLCSQSIQMFREEICSVVLRVHSIHI